MIYIKSLKPGGTAVYKCVSLSIKPQLVRSTGRVERYFRPLSLETYVPGLHLKFTDFL